jgi:hypothetical protein
MAAPHEDDPPRGADFEMAQHKVEMVHHPFGELFARVGPLSPEPRTGDELHGAIEQLLSEAPEDARVLAGGGAALPPGPRGR